MTDDPRLSLLIQSGIQGDIVLVGAPLSYARQRVSHKSGQQLGPCCLRRFFSKVGPLYNCQLNIDISKVKVSDFGNVNDQHPEKCISTLALQISSLFKLGKVPFIFGGSKQCMIAGARAFHRNYSDGKHIIITVKPNIKPIYGSLQTYKIDDLISQDDISLTSQNAGTMVMRTHPNSVIFFGVDEKYCQKVLNIVSIREIRNIDVPQGDIRTQAAFKMNELLNEDVPFHVSLTVSAIERFRGHRDVELAKLQVQEVIEMFLVLGKHKNVMSVDINEFNPSCEDYESSLYIVNLLYYFLMGWTLRK